MEKKTKVNPSDPAIIIGGMGVRISTWLMARIVAMTGNMGVVSGTGLEIIYPRILQDGDKGGHVRRAFKELARRQPALAQSVFDLYDKYYIEGGKAANKPYKAVPVWRLDRLDEKDGANSFWEPPKELQLLAIASNFAEVWLAKEGHKGAVGINFLRKVERPLLWTLYGAILADVDYVVVGAGNPSHLPGMIRLLCKHKDAVLPLKVYGTNSKSGEFFAKLRPSTLLGNSPAQVSCPKFLAIVSSLTLADALYSNPETRPYGFVIEFPEAGGHNAAPAKMKFDSQGQAVMVYTESDRADVPDIKALGLPFWLAGSYGSANSLSRAMEMGAAGIQVGTIAALCGQSGMDPKLRSKVLRLLKENKLKVGNTMFSPAGFPFKVAQVPGTVSDKAAREGRKRICDICLLQATYLLPDGSLGYRCPGEDVKAFVAKGGRAQNTKGRICLCNALFSTAGFPQVQEGGYVEPPIVTLGENTGSALELLKKLSPGQETYTISKVIHYLRGGYKR
ncbi:MAG: nitronate monooxygenase [Elusimicrobiota bacterium]|nr:nitronate monooxygenase [Elusimicrobiota bacterium]